MPATRSKSSAATKQTKLSFSSLKRTGSSQDTKKGKKASVKAHEFTQSQDDTEKEPAEVKPQALPVAVPEELPAPREELRVNDPRWKGVLKDAREKMSYHEPIHGEGENKIHQILRVFDMQVLTNWNPAWFLIAS
ncbi:hypothetical protein V5O48_010529 [Marasmius crinis-equi]|uniref:Uncharacterized protein n=1 Tax=Marasmius crinis-equi TaxID=585013 RepID=A0ABR3F868_9AGAR